MEIQTVRCKHCGNHYDLQLSGYGWWDYNADRSDDYCPECYAIIKNELNALEAKLNSKEMKEREQRYQHAYVKADDIKLDDVLAYCKLNWPNRNVCNIDGWGYECYPYSCELVYVRGNEVYRKYLIDTKEDKVVSTRCSIPHRYRDDVNRCTTYKDNNK